MEAISKETFLEYFYLNLPQIITCLIYDSVIDICSDEGISFISTFIIGVTYVATTDLEKLQVLLIFIALSVLIILLCKLIGNQCKLQNNNISTNVYLIVIIGTTFYILTISTEIKLFGFENPKNLYILAIAFMSFLSYTIEIINNPEKSNFVCYFSWQFLGYMFHPAKVLSGPWFAPELYYRFVTYRWQRRQYFKSIPLWNKKRVWKIINLYFLSYLFFISSKYIIPTINENINLNTPWLLMFSKCLRHRFTHYAHYFLNTAAMTCSGLHLFIRNENFPLTHPLQIEFPVSLANALAAYDTQLTTFFYRYLPNRFGLERTIYPRMETITIPLIYILLCHDQFYPLVVIMLTLYIFVVTQTKALMGIAETLSICVRRQPCVDYYCTHKFKKNHLITYICKLVFIIVNVIMLNYVYISLIENEFKTHWKSLNYMGHHILFGYYIIGQITQGDKLEETLLERKPKNPGYKVMFSKSTDTADLLKVSFTKKK